jgi:lysyl-tRNA synthetase class II
MSGQVSCEVVFACVMTLSIVSNCLLIDTLYFSLDERDFLEVQTPMMNKIAGGATAKPFKTYVGVLP